jgi:formylglycine-generating enzyme required for sulfatase activity
MFVKGALVLAMLLLDAGGPFAGLEGGRPPPRIEPFWAGLDAPRDRAPSSGGVVALREPLERRVRIAGAKFVMGSTQSEIQRARELCFREPAGERFCQEDTEEYRLMFSEMRPHEVTVSDFELDRTEVPVRRYARCVAAGACSPPAFPASDARYDRPELPVTHVTWDDAQAYCKWVGGRLPTEAEWEHAATGRAGHVFPWGDLYNPHLANHGSLADDETDARDGFVGLAPIGSFPDGATRDTGLLDMAGNAAEWVFDFYDRDTDGLGYPGAAVVDPKGPTSSPYGHVIRGGSYRTGAHTLRAAARRFAFLAGAPATQSRDIGFRCAYDVAERTRTP